MLKLIKNIEVKGKIKGLISNAINDVIKEFDERADIHKFKKLEVYVTDDPINVSRKIISSIKLRRHSEFKEWISANSPSLSYWAKGKTPIIMLNAQERIFRQQNIGAIKGLFAHELMHLLNKQDGIEEELEDEAEIAGQNILKFLSKHKEIRPFTQKRLMVSFFRVTTTTMFYIKDILANTRAMSFGFDEHLYEHYRVSLSTLMSIDFTEKDILEALKKDKKHVLDNAFLIYVGLNTTWLTFKMFRNAWYLKLQKLAKIKVPKIIKQKGDEVLEEMLKLRSGHDEKQIAKILKLSQQSYFDVVQHFCKKLKSLK